MLDAPISCSKQRYVETVIPQYSIAANLSRHIKMRLPSEIINRPEDERKQKVEPSIRRSSITVRSIIERLEPFISDFFVHWMKQ